jgi:DNA polymerase
MATTEIDTLAEARQEIQSCRRCPLYLIAKKAVFGEGPAHSSVIFVGEQPGDQEDLQGRPFVGPAGRLFDQALEAAGIDRRRVYITNAVKRFKHEQLGKRRLHKKPSAREIDACRFWLDLERSLLRPKIIVALGATALRGVMGTTVPISILRGGTRELETGDRMIATVHPSYLLRIHEPAAKARERKAFVADLKRVLALASEIAATARR